MSLLPPLPRSQSDWAQHCSLTHLIPVLRLLWLTPKPKNRDTTGSQALETPEVFFLFCFVWLGFFKMERYFEIQASLERGKGIAQKIKTMAGRRGLQSNWIDPILKFWPFPFTGVTGANYWRPESQPLYHCWVYYCSFLLLALRWRYSCSASIMLCNPHCSHRGHTIVPACHCSRALTSLWDTSMRRTLTRTCTGLWNTSERDVRLMSFSWMPGSCPYLI